MRSVRFLMLATAAVLATTSAKAADLPILKAPPPVYDDFGGWYLRGDIGMTNQRVGSLFNVLYNDPAVTSVNTVQKEFDSSPLFGLGIGYQFNAWLRADITGEYRGSANFKGLDIVNAGAFTDEYRGSKSEWLFLANAYIDLGTWWCFTPFVGAGIGFSRNTIAGFTDVNTPLAGVAYGDTHSKWNFAWALHAGIAYKVNPNFTVELAYRYVSLGDAMSGDLVTFAGVNAINNPMEFRNLTSHDLKLGVRWMLNPTPAAPSPLMRKG